MNIFNYQFQISTKGYNDVTDISPKVFQFILQSKIGNGFVLVFSPGSTCGITSIEYETGAIDDLKYFFEKLIPMSYDYKHNQRWHDGNGFSHIRSAFLKPNFSFPVIDGKPVLGTWQQVVFVDFDNTERSRNIYVQIIGQQENE